MGDYEIDSSVFLREPDYSWYPDNLWNERKSDEVKDGQAKVANRSSRWYCGP